MANKYLIYRDKPLVSCGNDIYYGSMSDKYIIHMAVESVSEINGVKVPSKVLVQLMYTDPDIRAKDRIVKVSEKPSISKAIEISEIWLKKALKE